MQIRVVRHGKPDYRYPARTSRVDAQAFNAALDGYDRAGLDPDWNRPRRPDVGTGRLFSSDLPRALETAGLCSGRDRGAMYVSPLFREIPLPRFRPGRLRLPFFVWMLAARLSWYFGWHRAGETRRRSTERVRRAADLLEEGAATEEVLLFAHGFFLWLLGRELKRRGWRTHKQGLYRYLEFATFTK